jgi:small Trp-rich protein
MPLVIVGVLLLAAWWADFGPFGQLPWWVVALPFAGAVAWWQFADSTGWTQRRAMDKMEKRKQDRRDRAMEALGLDHKRDRQVSSARKGKARATVAEATHRADDDTGAAPLAEPTQRRDPKL